MYHVSCSIIVIVADELIFTVIKIALFLWGQDSNFGTFHWRVPVQPVASATRHWNFGKRASWDVDFSISLEAIWAFKRLSLFELWKQAGSLRDCPSAVADKGSSVMLNDVDSRNQGKSGKDFWSHDAKLSCNLNEVASVELDSTRLIQECLYHPHKGVTRSLAGHELIHDGRFPMISVRSSVLCHVFSLFNPHSWPANGEWLRILFIATLFSLAGNILAKPWRSAVHLWISTVSHDSATLAGEGFHIYWQEFSHSQNSTWPM